MTIVFVDTETLGLDPDKHAIWEVGAIRYDETTGKVGDELLAQLSLTDEEVAAGDPVGMEIGRFAERRQVPAGFSPAAFSSMFARFADGAHLAGAVVSFDEERLRRMLLRYDITPTWHYHLIDVEALAVGYFNGVRRALGEPDDPPLQHAARDLPWKSDDLSAALGVTVSEEARHTALGDARWALDIYRAVTS